MPPTVIYAHKLPISINYIYLFEFDPRNVDTPIDIFNDAVDETLVFLLCMLLYYKVCNVHTRRSGLIMRNPASHPSVFDKRLTQVTCRFGYHQGHTLRF